MKSGTLESGIDDPRRVSPQQRAAIRADGNLFLLSRPGSGKTRTVGIRVARLAMLSTPMRVAATSYTNVAIDQIIGTASEWGVVLGPEHFAGTIHKFLLRYVLYPFGHLLPVEIKRPFHIVRNSKWSGWPEVKFRGHNRKRVSVADFHYASDATFRLYATPRIGLKRHEVETEEIDQVRKLKKEARLRGLVSLSDAMFYAQKILEDNPAICEAVAARFDELIVDEVQDTSDVQMRCLKLLSGSGRLKSLVLVGDLEQSIYGFQGAHPATCKDLADACGLKEQPLNENFRSSQAICDITCRFCGRDVPDKAVGKTAEIGLAPELILYESGNPRSAIESFAARISAHGLNTARAVVLARASHLRDEINGRPEAVEIQEATMVMARFAATFRSRGIVDRSELRAVESSLADMAWEDAPDRRSEEERARLRDASMHLLDALPQFKGTVAEWAVAARGAVSDALSTLSPTPARNPGNLMAKRERDKTKSAVDVFGTQPLSYWARTVHDVKGESHEAVLLVVESSGKGGGQAELWAKPLLGVAVDEREEEELRIAYVALSRAEKFCAIALPDDVSESTLATYLSAGFTKP